MPKSDHVVVCTDGEVHPAGSWLCEHCGFHYIPALPCPVYVYVGGLNAFTEFHARCPPPKKSTTNSD